MHITGSSRDELYRSWLWFTSHCTGTYNFRFLLNPGKNYARLLAAHYGGDRV